MRPRGSCFQYWSRPPLRFLLETDSALTLLLPPPPKRQHEADRAAHPQLGLVSRPSCPPQTCRQPRQRGRPTYLAETLVKCM